MNSAKQPELDGTSVLHELVFNKEERTGMSLLIVVASMFEFPPWSRMLITIHISFSSER